MTRFYTVVCNGCEAPIGELPIEDHEGDDVRANEADKAICPACVDKPKAGISVKGPWWWAVLALDNAWQLLAQIDFDPNRPRSQENGASDPANEHFRARRFTRAIEGSNGQVTAVPWAAESGGFAADSGPGQYTAWIRRAAVTVVAPLSPTRAAVLNQTWMQVEDAKRRALRTAESGIVIPPAGTKVPERPVKR